MYVASLCFKIGYCVFDPTDVEIEKFRIMMVVANGASGVSAPATQRWSLEQRRNGKNLGLSKVTNELSSPVESIFVQTVSRAAEKSTTLHGHLR